MSLIQSNLLDSSTQERVRCVHQKIVEGVDIDPTVLAAMYAQRVVNKHQNGQIHAIHMKSEPRDVIAAYFANDVINNWPDDIFEQQMKNLVKVLKESDDLANRSVADKLCRAICNEHSADYDEAYEEVGN